MYQVLLFIAFVCLGSVWFAITLALAGKTMEVTDCIPYTWVAYNHHDGVHHNGQVSNQETSEEISPGVR